MTPQRIWAVVVMVAAIMVILIPWVIFPTCGIGRYAPSADMPHAMHGCTHTLYAVTVLGVLVLPAGALPFFFPRRAIVLASALVTFILGALVILFPTMLSGVCMVATMPCVFGTKPALVASGMLLSILGLVGLAQFKQSP